MRARIHSRLVVLGVLVIATGCVRGYRPPTAHEPHADVQFRSIHHAAAGPSFEERVLVNGDPITLVDESSGVATGTVRVRPRATTYDFQTEFFHEETRWETQTYYQSESYLCGSGYWGPQYCTRQWPTVRTIPVLVRVRDGGCDAHYTQDPLAGAVYLVQYEFLADGVCQVTCQRLLEGPDGSLLATACGQGEPSTDGPIPSGPRVLAEVNVAHPGVETVDGARREPTRGGEVPADIGAVPQ